MSCVSHASRVRSYQPNRCCAGSETSLPGGLSDRVILPACRNANQFQISLSVSAWIRQAHRWISIAFTLAVIANLVALWRQAQTVWIGLSALVPLVLLLASGLYLFALPYLRVRR